MTNYQDLIEDDGLHPTVGRTRLKVRLASRAEVLVQPSMHGGGKVYLGARPDHLSNDEAMAIGLALIRCATDARKHES